MWQSPSFIHQVDSHDTIYEVNSDWLYFAQKNNYDCTFENTVLGHSLWEFIQNDHVIRLYKEIMRFVRSQEQSVTFNYRCDSEDTCRMMRMWVTPLPNRGHIEFRSVIENQFKHDRLRILNPSNHRSHEFIRMCSYCKSVKQNGEWIPLHVAMRQMDLMERDDYPSVSHGICPTCYKDVEKEIESFGKSG